MALAVGDPVHVTGTYTCAKADGSKPVVGQVSVANQKHGPTGAYPTAAVPGDVTVEARGWSVLTYKAAGALTAGIEVGINAQGRVAALGAGVSRIGVLLVSSAAVDDKVDVLNN